MPTLSHPPKEVIWMSGKCRAGSECLFSFLIAESDRIALQDCKSRRTIPEGAAWATAFYGWNWEVLYKPAVFCYFNRFITRVYIQLVINIFDMGFNRFLIYK